MIVREPMRFLHKPLTRKMPEWVLNRCETLVALYELKELLEKDWFIERMHLARMKIEEHNMLLRRKEEKKLKQIETK